ncbi:hypothetical protein FQ185_27435 [Pseudomonas sp. ANT_H12B]|nr:hypothetical protein FQ185_27435 [Pseudomonas sp. ANT_H12B]
MTSNQQKTGTQPMWERACSRKRFCQATSMSTDTPSSRAGSLPQVMHPAPGSITRPIFASGVPESRWHCPYPG